MNETQNLITERATDEHITLSVSSRCNAMNRTFSDRVVFFFTFSSSVLIGDSDKQPTVFFLLFVAICTF